MKRRITTLLAITALLLGFGGASANALTVYPSTGYYSWNGVWYCWHDYTFWDRLWSLNPNLHDGYYNCPYPRTYRA